MDLFRSLRVSIYLLVASGAFAIWEMERQMFYLAFVAAAGVLAYFTVDAGRWKPLRHGFAGALSVALLLYFLVPALEFIKDKRGQEAVALMTHFLCLVQTMLFFTVYRGSAILTFCGSTLFVVIVSGILNPSGTLLLRLLLFLGATTWTLFLHALLRARTKYEDLVPAARPETPAGRTPGTGPGALSERTLWQGLLMTGLLSVGCLAAGLLLFFFWPRLQALTFLQSAWSSRTPAPPAEAAHEGVRPASLPLGSRPFTGFDPEGTDLNQAGKLSEDPTPALRVTFTPPPQAWLGPDRIFLRAMAYPAFSYARNRWLPPDFKNETRRLTAEKESVEFGPGEPHHLALPGQADLVRQVVRLLNLREAAYFTLAPLRRLRSFQENFDGVLVDEEGCVRVLDGSARSSADRTYEAYSQIPAQADALPPAAAARSLGPRYLDWRSDFPAPSGEAVVHLLGRLLRGVAGDAEKARKIRDYLRDSGEYGYTLERQGQSLDEFLFGAKPRRSGPCGYFATAHVILCRAAGLPARYVQGFAHTLTSSEAGASDVLIRNLDAHAWSEVYFEPYGWVAFDATPPAPEEAGGLETAQGRPPAPLKSSSAQDAWLADSPSDRRGWFERCWSYVLDYDQREQSRVFQSMSERVGGVVESAGQALSGSGTWGRVRTVMLWVLGVFLAAWLALIFWRRQDPRQSALANLPPRARTAVLFYDELLHVLGKRGFVRRLGQTPREFAAAVVRRGGETLAPVWIVTELFERVRYGGEDISPEELARVRRSFETLQEQARRAGGSPVQA